jgi:C-terminal processing protease CtpA/Prc
MMRTRTVFMAASMAVILLFTGLLLANKNSQDAMFRALGNLAEVVHLVENEYVDELNQEALKLSLDAGLVKSLDRSAAVLPPDQVNAYLELVESPPPFGLGLSSRLGSAAVEFVLPGSPAEAAGLDTWEVIELVQGVNSRGRPLWQIRLELLARENKGEKVHLTVFDREVDERRDVVLEPKEWTVRPATAELRNEATVIHLEALTRDATEAVVELMADDRPVILDLRELRWGLEPEAVELADVFVDEGVLGAWKGRRAGGRSYSASAGTAGRPMPVVLVGSRTNGAGEVLASALQRHGAVLVGERTAGHAPFMTLVQDGDVSLWIPVGEWLRGDEEPINGNGIEPDEPVEEGEPDAEADAALARALEILSPELEKAA